MALTLKKIVREKGQKTRGRDFTQTELDGVRAYVEGQASLTDVARLFNVSETTAQKYVVVTRSIVQMFKKKQLRFKKRV